MADSRSKAERFQAVEEAVLHLIADQGLSRVTISKIASRSKVSRPWIYKNLGKSMKPLIAHAAQSMGKRFAEFERPWSVKSYEEAVEEFRQSARSKLQDAEKYPWLTQLYFQHLGHPGPIGEAIREIEAALLQKNDAILQSQFKIPASVARLRSIKMVKATMAFSHCWVHEAGFKKIGMEKVVDCMVPDLTYSI